MRRALLVILLPTAVPAFAGYDLEELTSRYDGILNVTFGPFSVRDGAVLRASSRVLPPEVLAERAGRQMEALADLHRADDIVAIVDALPPVARHHLASSVWLLAGASAIVADKPVRAREFLLHVKPDKDLKASLDLVRSLLTPGLADHDAFEVLAHFLGVTDGIWCDAFVLLAVRSGYNRIADTKRALAAATGPAGTAADEVLPTLPGDLAAELRACLWHERARWRPVVATSTGPLAADRIVPRLEEAAPTFEREAVALSAEAVAEVKVPLAWQAVRLEQRGDVSTGLALSEVLDPVEDTAGAFWLLRSSDGGKPWEPPRYTGIRDSSPAAGEIAARYLRMPWDSLRRDSDGDGVPDLVEALVGTDPLS